MFVLVRISFNSPLQKSIKPGERGQPFLLPGRELSWSVPGKARDLLRKEFTQSLLQMVRRVVSPGSGHCPQPSSSPIVSVIHKVSISVLESNFIFCIIGIVGIVFRSGSISSYACSQHHFSQGPADKNVWWFHWSLLLLWGCKIKLMLL